MIYDYEDNICVACNGTGEGQQGDTSCHSCKGTGMGYRSVEDDLRDQVDDLDIPSWDSGFIARAFSKASGKV